MLLTLLVLLDSICGSQHTVVRGAVALEALVVAVHICVAYGCERRLRVLLVVGEGRLNTVPPVDGVRGTCLLYTSPSPRDS